MMTQEWYCHLCIMDMYDVKCYIEGIILSDLTLILDSGFAFRYSIERPSS